MDLTAYLESRRLLVEKALQRWVPGEKEFPAPVHEAMRYSLFAGGKRLRPILLLAATEAAGGKSSDALPLACSLELIHTYSLIHDDLPAMDDDDLRRGKPTSHKVFGEALAILAGDALLTEAFHLMARPDLMRRLSPDRRLQAIHMVAREASTLGLIGGQAMDILSQGKKVEPSLVEYIHSHKTGALIAAAVGAGAIVGGAEARAYRALTGYGRKLGLAFQVVDDLLDLEGQERNLGKTVGKDRAKGKITYPRIFGVPASRRKAEELVAGALAHLASFSRKADPLRAIARFVLERES
ncbi:MAG: polyprenyl synthetase family protein [Deltaproteobacteria bacterium]|nr:polyprenyl synthetase family protein [Deltaproteobacteria bacterium]